MSATHAWCPACKESSAIDREGNCLWCGGATEPDRPKPGGWKRPDLAGSKYTEPQLRALHLAHTRGAPQSTAAATFGDLYALERAAVAV